MKSLITTVFLSVLFVVSVNTQAESSSKAAPNPFVGAYYGQTGGMITFHSDGTFHAVRATMFSFAEPFFRRQTSRVGVWRKVGKNEIRVTNIQFLTEQFGDVYYPDGVIVKITFSAVFDKPVRGKSPGYTTSTGVAEIFLPDQNPTLDDPVQTIPLPGGGVGFRLEVEVDDDYDDDDDDDDDDD